VKSPLAVMLFALPILAPGRAQSPTDRDAREAQLIQKATAGMHAVADGLAAQKQHLRALDLRRELWLEYAPEDAKAREATGFVRVGDLWRRDESRIVADIDLPGGDKKALKKIDEQWAALGKVLLAEHRALAQDYGSEPAAQRHWRRVLRFAPADAAAATALALAEFEGFPGTPADLVVLRRGRAIRGACEWLNRHEFPVVEVKGEPHPLLAQCKIEHTTLRTRHFSVWGTLPTADLMLIAADAERALLLARRLFDGVDGRVLVPRIHRDLVYLHDPAAYAAVLDACRDQFDAERLRFLRDEVQLAFVRQGDGWLRVHKVMHELPAQRDQAVRGVVQDAAGILSDSMSEGLGHAACGFLFDRTLTFRTEQLRERTSTDWRPRALAPDMAVWRQIAEESAWAKSDSRTSQLRMMSAAKFTNEQRVKAWAICHWFAMMDPRLILELEACKGEAILNAVDVETEFLRRTGLELPRLDHEWREFWGKGMALRFAMERDPVPPEAATALPGASATPTLSTKTKPGERTAALRARSLVDAVNLLRIAGDVPPVAFYVSASPDAQVVAQYTVQLAKAEAAAAKKPKEAPPMPAVPPALGRTILWSRATEPQAAVFAWWQQPKLRDAMLHPGRELLASALDATHWALDLTLPATPLRAGLPVSWPAQGQPGVPGEANLEQLGPRAMKAFAAIGKTGPVLVGMPLTLHFARELDDAARGAVRGRIYADENPVDSLRIDYGPAGDDGEQTPGCIAVVPLKPLPPGSKVEVRWTLPDGVLGKDETYAPIRFEVR
jgi:hypothetical protein